MTRSSNHPKLSDHFYLLGSIVLCIAAFMFVFYKGYESPIILAGCSITAVGFIAEIVITLEKNLVTSKRKIITFIIYPLVGSTASLIAYNCADWIALDFVNRATFFDPAPYTHTSSILLVFGFGFVIAVFLSLLLVLFYFEQLVSLVYLFLKDTVTNVVAIVTGRRIRAKGAKWWYVSVGRIVGATTLIILLAAILDQNKRLLKLVSWSVHVIDHYSEDMCTNINLEQNEKIAYIGDDLVSISSWNGFSNAASFRIEKCFKFNHGQTSNDVN